MDSPLQICGGRGLGSLATMASVRGTLSGSPQTANEDCDRSNSTDLRGSLASGVSGEDCERQVVDSEPNMRDPCG